MANNQHMGALWKPAVVVVLGVLALFGARSFSGVDQRPETVSGPPLTERLHPVVLNPGHRAPVVATGLQTPHGTPVEISCATCHAAKSPNQTRNETAGMESLHRGLPYAHGGLACLSCHNPGDYGTLRLANGVAVPFERAMELCTQCHGPQARDYRNGSHGGMTGYWDLAAGPQQRNTCVDCHQPHVPAFPKVSPVFAPRDGLPAAGNKPTHAVDHHGTP